MTLADKLLHLLSHKDGKPCDIADCPRRPKPFDHPPLQIKSQSEQAAPAPDYPTTRVISH